MPIRPRQVLLRLQSFEPMEIKLIFSKYGDLSVNDFYNRLTHKFALDLYTAKQTLILEKGYSLEV